MNELLGTDLQMLLEKAATHHIPYPEETRVVAKHRERAGSVRMAPCAFFLRPSGCSKGADCEYLHLERDTKRPTQG